MSAFYPLRGHKGCLSRPTGHVHAYGLHAKFVVRALHSREQHHDVFSEERVAPISAWCRSRTRREGVVNHTRYVCRFEPPDLMESASGGGASPDVQVGWPERSSASISSARHRARRNWLDRICLIVPCPGSGSTVSAEISVDDPSAANIGIRVGIAVVRVSESRDGEN